MPKNNSKPIFISHAVADKAIADKVVDLLNTAMNINVQEAVFCTSLEGLKIPPGKDFKLFIKEQIQEPKIVLLLISKNYLASQFCLAELGASWALSHRIIPFLIPPLDFDDMKAVLAGIHALKIEASADWNEALATFTEVLGIVPNPNRWERKRNEHIAAIVSLIPEQPDPPIVPLKKLQEAEARIKGANEEIADLEVENRRISTLLQKLKKAKDAKEVAKIELASLPASEAFEQLVKQASNALSQFSSQVQEAFYYHFRGESPPAPRFGMSDTEDRLDELNRAIEDGYLTDEYSLNEGDPGIRRTIDALTAVKDLIQNAPELEEPYEEENDHQLNFSSRQFWNTNLC